MSKKRSNFLKKAVSLVLCFAIFFSIACGTFTAQATNISTKGSATLGANDTVQDYIDGILDVDWYTVVPTRELYYCFSIRNQSAELRTGIVHLDTLVNLFLGELTVEIFDQYDDRLASTNVRCGYTNSVSVKLVPGNTYKVKVTSTIAGNYRITTKTIEDIGPDRWQDALEVESNGEIVSSIDADDDQDWYVFTSDSERSYYNFSLENLSKTGSQQFWLYEYVAGAGEIPWRDITDFNVYSGNTGSISLQLKENTKYCYCVLGRTGGYVLDVEQTLDVAGPSFDTAYNVELDTKYTTTFDGTNDIDYYSFTTDSDNAYYHINFESLNSEGTEYVYLYDSMANPVEDDYRYGIGNLSYNVQLKPNSTYYLYIKGTKTGNYTFSVNKKADTYFDNKENATPIEFGTTYSTSFDGTNDVDYLCFTTDSDNAYYHINFESLNSEGTEYVYLYDSMSNLVKDDYRYGIGKLSYNVQLKPNSTYYLYINGTKTGNYTFSVNKKTDTYFDSMEKATMLQFNKEYKSSFDGTMDADYFKFITPEYDAVYSFQGNVTSSCHYELHLYDVDGTVIDNNYTYSGGKVSLIADLEPNAIYYVRMLGHVEGKYTLFAECDRDYEGNSRDDAKTINLNEIYEGKLGNQEDVDWFKFTVEYDDDYRVYVDNETDSLELYLYNSREGLKCDKVLWEELDTTVFLEAGTYYIKVNRYSRNPKYYSIVVADCGNGHKEKSVYSKKAGIGEVGTKKIVCSKCSKLIRTEKVPAIETIKLSATSYTYTGSTRTPTVTVKDSTGKTISSSNYTVTYASGRKNAGTYKVTVTMKGNYSGTKTLSFKINPISISKCSVKLSTTSYTYNGKAKTPSVTVKSAKGTMLTRNTYYTVTYDSGRINVGKYKVTIKMQGNYSGTKTLYYKINPVKTSVLKVTAGKKSLKVYVSKKSTQVTGYQIYYSTSKSFKSYKSKYISSYKTTSATLKNLSAKKTYYVKVRTYKTVKGVKYYSGWSTVKYKKTK